MTKQYDLADLLYLMQRLRDPETGCPWDIKQSFASIVAHTLEEAHEVADAIEQQDWPHLEEELGDLLFQVIFYGQLGREQGLFDVTSVIDGLVSKLLRRHPHVFPGGDLSAKRAIDSCPSETEIKAQWQVIKEQEKMLKAQRISTSPIRKNQIELVDYLQDIPATLPALTQADKIQKKVSMRGFDWTEIEGVIAKVREELQEVEDEIAAADPERLQHEVGDLIFASVNLARHLGIQPEQALGRANRRFSERYSIAARALAAMGRPLDLANPNQVSSAEMEAAWDDAKRIHPQLIARLSSAANDGN
jgi:nucleoside triphosphate diphosphatase